MLQPEWPPQQGQGFLLCQHGETAPGLTLLSVHSVHGALILEVKLPEQDVYSSTSSAKDKNALITSFTSVYPHIHDMMLSHVGNLALLTTHDHIPISWETLVITQISTVGVQNQCYQNLTLWQSTPWLGRIHTWYSQWEDNLGLNVSWNYSRQGSPYRHVAHCTPGTQKEEWPW
jgi:hypothetical protein